MMRIMNYTELMEKYKKPLNVAIALGIVTMEDTYRAKCNASARVCMWKKFTIPPKWAEKLAELDKV